jgi:uncharacterized protein
VSALLRTSRYLRVVPRDRGAAIYHGAYGRLSFVGPEALRVLTLFETPRSSAPAPEAFVDACLQSGFLVPADFNEDADIEERRVARAAAAARGGAVRAVQLVLANACNFRCAYCFEGLGATPIAETVYANASAARIEAQTSPRNRMMRPEAAESYVGAALELVRAAGNDSLAVQFFGGEPLVNWRALEHVLRRFGPTSNGIRLTYSVVTNGSLITDEIAVRLAEEQVAVIVSYDGPTSVARPLRGGRSSHAQVTRGLDRLASHGNRVALNAAVTFATFDDFDRRLIDFAVEHGIAEVGVVLDFDPRFYSEVGAGEIVDRLWDVAAYGNARRVMVTGYWHQIFEAIVADDRYAALGYMNCSAMGAQLSIEPSGEVFACKASGARFGQILAWRSILQSDVYRAYAARSSTSPATCQGCELEFVCGGLCLGAIENAFGGDIYGVATGACDVYRGITRRLIQAAS